VKPTTLSVLTPVASERVEALEHALGALPARDRSPLARLENTHFARWAIVDPLELRGRKPPDAPHYLLFTSWFDGPVDDYLDALCERLPVEVDAIWAHCDGYPGLGDRARFKRYLLEHRVNPGLYAVGNEATVERVQAALHLREEVQAFVLESRRLDDAELQRRWRERFPREGEVQP
jgi:hypothetical protein